MTGGSQQLRRFRIARRDGATVEDAATIAGMSLDEATAWAKDDEDNPPPAEAYHLLGEQRVDEETRMTDEPSAELRSYLERVERLREEQRGIGEDIRDILAEAKSRGFDMLAFREMLRLRKMDADKRRDFQNAVEVYGEQLGLL